MTRILLALSFLVASLAACVEASEEGPAGRCAEVVRIFKGLQEPVEVVGQPVETSEGSVEIRYEGQDGMNLPARGSASCTFAVGEAGELTLLEASVDGTPLGPGDIESIRTELGG
jgi:hypothetical protein